MASYNFSRVIKENRKEEMEKNAATPAVEIIRQNPSYNPFSSSRSLPIHMFLFAQFHARFMVKGVKETNLQSEKIYTDKYKRVDRKTKSKFIDLFACNDLF
jgi:hypothetical protein